MDLATNIEKLRHFVLHNFYTLSYFYEAISLRRMYYNPKVFPKTPYLLAEGYALHQYRRLHSRSSYTADDKNNIEPKNGEKKNADNNNNNRPLLINPQPVHLRLTKYFFLLFFLRCMAIAYIPAATDSIEKRVWLGTEIWHPESFYFELTVSLDCLIGFLFLQFSFSRYLLHYKFVSVYGMKNEPKEKETDKWHPSYRLFGLTKDKYQQYDVFRGRIILLNKVTIVSFFLVGSASVFWMNYQNGLYGRYLAASLIWSVIMELFALLIFSVIFANLMAFILLVKYLLTKQELLAERLATALFIFERKAGGGNKAFWRTLLQEANLYSGLYGELQDYSHFWRPFITFIFFLSVSTIVLILYLSLYSNLAIYINVLFTFMLITHLMVFGAIIVYSGKLVVTNVRLSFKFASTSARLTGATTFQNGSLPLGQLIKLSCLTTNVKGHNSSGIVLLNEYLITYNTMRTLLFNVASNFILFLTH